VAHYIRSDLHILKKAGGGSLTCGEDISLRRSSSWIRLKATWALRSSSILSISLPISL